MTELSDEAFYKLTRLCRIACSELEKKRFQEGLKNILTHADQLQEINTDDIAPCFTVLEDKDGELRQDEEQISLTREELLDNAPAHVGGMVKVPPIIQKEHE